MTKSNKQNQKHKCSANDLDTFSEMLDAIIAEAKGGLPWARVADLEQAKLGIKALRKHREENP
jgi:hypothetical protein